MAPERPQLTLAVAGIAIALRGEDPRMPLAVGGAARRFLVEDARPDVTIEAAWDDLHGDPEDRGTFDSGGLWRLHSDGASHRFRFVSPAFGPRPYKDAFFDRDFTTGRVRLDRRALEAPGRPAYPLEYPLDELLVIHRLARGGGLEVHACGVVDAAGRGRLFVGQSGAGKTTMARLWAASGATILSDDRIVLRREDGRLWMYGTPWHGEAEFSVPARAPLTEVCLLGRGAENARVPLSAGAAAAALFAASFVPFHDAAGLAFSLGFLETVAASVPVCALAFVPDAGVVEFLGP